jgi:hypothetical protein
MTVIAGSRRSSAGQGSPFDFPVVEPAETQMPPSWKTQSCILSPQSSILNPQSSVLNPETLLDSALSM